MSYCPRVCLCHDGQGEKKKNKLQSARMNGQMSGNQWINPTHPLIWLLPKANIRLLMTISLKINQMKSPWFTYKCRVHPLMPGGGDRSQSANHSASKPQTHHRQNALTDVRLVLERKKMEIGLSSVCRIKKKNVVAARWRRDVEEDTTTSGFLLRGRVSQRQTAAAWAQKRQRTSRELR